MKRISDIAPGHILMRAVLFSLSVALLVTSAGCPRFGESKTVLAKRRVLQQVRASMVPVRIHFKRDIPNEFSSDDDEVSYQKRFASRMVERG